jgi:hypothetical protein
MYNVAGKAFRNKLCICFLEPLNSMYFVRFQVLKAVSMMFTVFWDVVLCSLVKIDWCIRGASCPPITTLKMEAVSTSEEPINFYKTTWRNNPEDNHLHYILNVI